MIALFNILIYLLLLIIIFPRRETVPLNKWRTNPDQ